MKKKIFSSLIFASILVLSACGGDNESEEASSNSGAGETVEITATNWDIETDVTTVEAGEVTFTLVNDEGHHGISIEGTDLTIDGEGSDTVTLEPGEYTIICTIPCGEGHEEMTAVITVT
ncbi:cytochrome C oxidase subunit II [Salipaludibacillus sp. HK11]|uniref:cytochrome C oxidase subunit II n=1 Tax=Salipaludibacillus sp. HK11 TaxID=3394320 RepID=UPI0039FD3680